MPDTKTKTTLHEDVQATLKRLEAKDKGLGQLIKKAHGHAVFPSVGKASLVVGGSYGRGLVFEKGKFIGYATISQLTLGVQIGGDTFSEVVIFESPQALDRFKQGKMAFAANASAVLVKAAAAGTGDFPKGVKALAYSRGGMLLEAAIGAQKFKFKPADEEEQDDQQDESEGQKGGGRAKANSGQGQKAKGRSSDDDDEEQDQDEGGEDESGGILSRATGVLRDHPIAATLVGVGLAGAAMLVLRKLRSSGSESDQSDEDQGAEDQEDDDQAQDSSDQGDQDEDEGQDEDDRGRNGRGNEDEGDEEVRGGRGGDMLGFLRRRRSRA